MSSARQRYALLRVLAGVEEGAEFVKPHVWDKSDRINICITPCQEITKEAAAELFRAGWEEGRAQKRVIVGGLPYEGLVLIDPESLHKGGRSNKWKVKPFHSVDICVTQLCRQQTGKVPVYEAHGHDLKTGEMAKITSGISPGLFARLEQARENYSTLIIEVEVSSLRELPSANPTIQSIRFDKMGAPKREREMMAVA